MLGVFSGEVVEVPEELVVAGSRTPSPKTRAAELMNRFLRRSAPAVSIQLGYLGHLAYSHTNQSPFAPRMFAAKDEIYCLFQGVLTNLGSLRQQYGLSKSADEVVLVMEAYKALRDRAPFPPSFMLAHLSGNFAFVLFDKSTSSILVASVRPPPSLPPSSVRVRSLFSCSSCMWPLPVLSQDPDGRVPLFWGITADGCLAFADDLDLLKGSCGKSLAPFPKGCYYSNALGGLKSYENPKHKVTAVLENEEEVCGATFKVEGPAVVAATR
ncbi:Stem-specific protein [Musa troglodytarum]|uniref:Stem-specific protein n=1 Tax=Musa troglodytarum TaxID=320322 RepID=A0A9E7KVY3_9LILI|nr:Stem-specific protein [Musa troglodytarum]